MFADEESRFLADLTLKTSMKLGFKNFHDEASSSGVKGSDAGVFLGRGLKVIRLWDKDRTYIHTVQDTPNTLYSSRLVETAKVTLATLHALSTMPLSELFPKTYRVQTEGLKKPAIFSIAIFISFVLISLQLFIVSRRIFSARSIGNLKFATNAVQFKNKSVNFLM